MEVLGHKQASKLLTNGNIQERIAELKLQRADKVGVTSEWVLNEAVRVYKVAIADIPLKTSVKGLNNDEAIKELYKTNLHEANRALEIIGKHIDVRAFEKQIDTYNTQFSITLPNELK